MLPTRSMVLSIPSLSKGHITNDEEDLMVQKPVTSSQTSVQKANVDLSSDSTDEDEASDTGSDTESADEGEALVQVDM